MGSMVGVFARAREAGAAERDAVRAVAGAAARVVEDGMGEDRFAMGMLSRGVEGTGLVGPDGRQADMHKCNACQNRRQPIRIGPKTLASAAVSSHVLADDQPTLLSMMPAAMA